MDDFWQQSGQTVTVQQSYQPPQQSYQPPQQHQQPADDEQFDFSNTQHQTHDYENNNSPNQFNTISPNKYSSQSGVFEEDEVSRTIREEEQRIHQQLQQKAQQEYELKQKRKQQAREWLQHFFNKKQQQNHQRKEENIRRQEQLVNPNKDSSTSWNKVAKSVDLKLSEYKGSKDINRMREAIQHKRQDESSF